MSPPARRVAAAGFVAAALGAMACLCAGTARRTSSTFDEPYNLAAGYAALVQGDLRLTDRAFGPLARMLFAAPLALRDDVDAPAFGARTPPSEARVQQDWRAGAHFLFANRAPHDRLLWSGRLPAIALGLALLLAVGAAAQARHGAVAGAIALVLFAFEPLILAHTPIVGTDLAAALFTFLSVECARRGDQGRRWLVAAGLAFGAGLATKTSLAIVLPAIALLTPGDLRARARRLGIVLAAAAVAVIVGYRLRPDEALRTWSTLRGTGSALEGTGGYLLGTLYPQGNAFYYPVALVLKSSVALLLLGAARALVDAAGLLRRRTKPADLADLVLPAVFLLVLAVGSRFQHGVRHALPVLPFLVVYAAGLPARLAEVTRDARLRRAAAIAAPVVLCCHVAETVLAYPRYISHFAWPWPRTPPPLLLDSNLDWGQDMPELARALRARGIPGVYLAAAWVGDPAAYGVSYQRIPDGGLLPEGDHVFGEGEPRVVAISANLLFRGDHPWLLATRPLGVVSNTIYLFDVSDDPAAHVALAEGLLQRGRPDRAAEVLLRGVRLGARPPARLVEAVRSASR